MFALKESSPVVVKASVAIQRPSEQVFRFIGERFVANYPRWSPEVLEVKQISPGPVRVGMRARQVRVDLGHRTESVFAVTIFEHGRRICFEGMSCPYRCDYALEEIRPNHSTRLSFTFELPRVELYMRPFETLIREAIRDGVERTVGKLKSLLEAERSECVPGHRPALGGYGDIFAPARVLDQARE